jgi:hypothetical protein
MRPFVVNFLLILIMASCKNEIEFEYPLVYTGEVIDIRSDGAMFCGKIASISASDVLEYGFVWDIKSTPTIESSEKYIIREPAEIGIYKQQISTTLQEGVHYYVRAFVRSNKYITYGQEVTFISLGSLAPQIIDFTPKLGNVGDTLIILGRNFSHKMDNNHVQMGQFQAKVLKANQDTLVIVVPGELNILESTITVSIINNKVTSADKFNLIPPVVNDFAEEVASFGDEVRIYGANFLTNPSSLKVYFDNFRSTIVSIQDNCITVLVPDSLNTSKSTIKVEMNNLIVSSPEQFQLAPVAIIDFFPKTVLTGNTITLTGSNFSPIPESNHVTIGGLKANVLEVSRNELKVRVPLQDVGYYPSRNPSIKVEILGDIYTLNETLLIDDKWFRLKDSPFLFLETFYVVLNDKAYIGINSGVGFWEYDPITNEFSRLLDFPGLQRTRGNGFAINNKVYYGTGLTEYTLEIINHNDFWEYDPNSKTWTQKANFAGSPRNWCITFSINGFGYLGGGITSLNGSYNNPYDDFWKYDPISDAWSRIPSYIGADSASIYGTAGGISVTVGDLAYIGLGRLSGSRGDQRWFCYNSMEKSWKERALFPYSRNYSAAIAFNLNGFPYAKTVISDFYSYDSSLNLWQHVETDLIPNRSDGIGFSIGGKGYVGIGKAFWEYDPAR